MASIVEGFVKAFSLILHLDVELLGIIALSIKVSGTALVVATLLGLPLSALLGFRKFPLRRFVISILNTLMGLPQVVVFYEDGTTGVLKFERKPSVLAGQKVRVTGNKIELRR